MAAELGAECATRGARRGTRCRRRASRRRRRERRSCCLRRTAQRCRSPRAGSTLAGCLRNAAAVAGAAMQIGHRITIVAAGERWPSGETRPALEDWIGAGAVVARMAAERTPEASAAQAGFKEIRFRLLASLLACRSGQELAERGYPEDVRWAAELDANRRAPLLVEQTFLAVNP
ncbi:MAG: 2-phosphosulfolactate phosphatase [Myxococcota bacterium]